MAVRARRNASYVRPGPQVGTLGFVPPLLRYGVFELLLVQPLMWGFWRAPDAPPDRESSLRAAVEHGYREGLRRDPSTLRAPAAWPAELALLAAEAFEWTWHA